MTSNPTHGPGAAQGAGRPFVDRFEMAIMQLAILGKARQQGGVTRENLQQTFRGNLQMGRDHLDECLRILASEGRLREQNGKYVATDEGREDVQKVQALALELPSLVQGAGARPGMATQATAGGNVPGNFGGQTTGTQGGYGTNEPEPVGGARQNLNQGSVNKGGATRPAGEKASERGQPGRGG